MGHCFQNLFSLAHLCRPCYNSLPRSCFAGESSTAWQPPPPTPDVPSPLDLGALFTQNSKHPLPKGMCVIKLKYLCDVCDNTEVFR